MKPKENEKLMKNEKLTQGQTERCTRKLKSTRIPRLPKFLQKSEEAVWWFECLHSVVERICWMGEFWARNERSV